MFKLPVTALTIANDPELSDALDDLQKLRVLSRTGAEAGADIVHRRLIRTMIAWKYPDDKEAA